MRFEFGGRSASRRRVLHATGAGVAAGFAGCLSGDSGPVPDPIDLSGQKTDYQGGMVIGDHGGPNGQVFYADARPEPKQGPREDAAGTEHVAWFHTLAHGLFPYHFDMVDDGAEAVAVYVTDYSRVEWDVPSGTERKLMPAPTAPDTFADATGLTYAVDTDVMGGMGPDLMPFSDPQAAEAFADDHGGQTVAYDEIDRALVEGIRMTGM